MKSLIIFFTLIGSLTFFEASTEQLDQVDSLSIELNDPCGCVECFFDCRKSNPGPYGLLYCAAEFEQCDLNCPS